MRVIMNIRERPGKPVIRINMESEGGTTVKVVIRNFQQAEVDGAMKLVFGALTNSMGEEGARQTLGQMQTRISEIQVARGFRVGKEAA